MKINGYIFLKESADTKFCTKGGKSYWVKKPLRAIEINEESKSALAVDSSGVNVGMFDFKDILYKFHCSVISDIIVPKGLPFFEEMEFVSRRKGREKGYSPLIRAMVIRRSLYAGKVRDSFLFEKEVSKES
jgi:hypothetical protein